MNIEQINLLKEKYNIIFRGSKEYVIKTNNDISLFSGSTPLINERLYEIYSYYYYRHSEGLDKNNIFNNLILNKKEVLNYDSTVFKKFSKLDNKCIIEKHKKYVSLYRKKYEDFYKELLYLNYKKIKLYKTMDGFNNLEEEREFIKKNHKTPFWFSASYNAYRIINGRHGGIHAYKLNENERLKILVISCENIKLLIKLCIEKLKPVIVLNEKSLKKKYLLDLLRLSACSERGIKEQMSIFAKFNNYDNEIWITDKPYNNDFALCNIEINNEDYFGIVKAKGYHNYNFAYLLQYLNINYFNNYFDGYIVKHKYSPYFFSGVILEEIILFDAYSKIHRNIEDKYDWTNYISELNITIPQHFKLPYLYSMYNINYKLFKLYDLKYNSELNTSFKNYLNNNISIIFLNCNNFKSVNINDSIESNKNMLSNLLNYINVDIVILTNATNYRNLNYINYNHPLKSSNNNSIFLINNNNNNDSIKNIINSILVLNIEIIKPIPYSRPSYDKFTPIIETNYKNYIKNINAINYLNYNIIYNSNTYLNSVLEEIKYLEKNYKLINQTTSFYRDNDNILLYKKYEIVFTNIMDYNRSYFLPQLLIIKNE